MSSSHERQVLANSSSPKKENRSSTEELTEPQDTGIRKRCLEIKTKDVDNERRLGTLASTDDISSNLAQSTFGVPIEERDHKESQSLPRFLYDAKEYLTGVLEYLMSSLANMVLAFMEKCIPHITDYSEVFLIDDDVIDEMEMRNSGSPTPKSASIRSAMHSPRTLSDLDVDLTIKKLQADLSMKLKDMWLDPDTSDTQVRGLNYIKDKKKVPAGESMGKLIHLDVLWLSKPERHDHIALWEMQRPNSIINRFRFVHPDMIIFIVNFQVPRNPHECVVCYWAVPSQVINHDDKKSHDLFLRFINGDDHFRNERFKLIPRIVEGPILVRGTIAQRPALTGRKFTHRYFKGENYFEVDMDLGSSVIATQIVSLCAGYCTKIVVNISFLVQGEAEEELQEKIIGSVCFNRLNLGHAHPLE